MKAINTHAHITSIRSRRDGSLGFSVETPELEVFEKVAFMNLQGLNLKMLIEPLDEPVEEVVEIDKELGLKSQSGRIRSVLFVVWKHLGEQGDFRDFYIKETEKMIEHYKNKLD